MATPPTEEEAVVVPREVIAKEALIASIGILVFLGVVKHIGAFVPIIGRHAFTIAAAVQLYVPIYLVGKRGITLKSLGLRTDKLGEDLLLVFALAIITTVPFAIGHHFWQTLVFKRAFLFRLPDNLLEGVVIQVCVVALAEETFFRGYLQERFDRLWPAKRALFGVPFGRAIITAAFVFSLAHFVGEYRFDRLGPFFPALVFGLLRKRTGTIVGAIGYHAFCNILGEVAWASYHS